MGIPTNIELARMILDYANVAAEEVLDATDAPELTPDAVPISSMQHMAEMRFMTGAMPTGKVFVHQPRSAGKGLHDIKKYRDTVLENVALRSELGMILALLDVGEEHVRWSSVRQSIEKALDGHQ